MAKCQYNDRYQSVWADEVTANATDGGVTNVIAFDTSMCDAPTLNVRIKDLATGKKIKFKLQESDSQSTGFVDVADGVVTDLVQATEYEADGVHDFYYAGNKRYCRLVVVSVGATPAAKVLCIYQRHKLHDNPKNQGF